MNKADLVNRIAEGANISKTQALTALNIFLEATSDALKSGEKVSITGFGTFNISYHKARRGRNPQNGRDILIDARNVVKFKAGIDLSAKVQDAAKVQEA